MMLWNTLKKIQRRFILVSIHENANNVVIICNFKRSSYHRRRKQDLHKIKGKEMLNYWRKCRIFKEIKIQNKY